MGNKQSSAHGKEEEPKSFPGSALLDNAGMLCGSLTDTDDTGDSVKNPLADGLCASSPEKDDHEAARAAAHKKELLETKANPTSALFARALVSEVTDNPKTMTPAAMAEREKKLLKAQQRANANANANHNNHNNSSNNSNGSHRSNTKNGTEAKPVGVPGGIGQPSVLGSIAHALGTDVSPMNDTNRRNNNNNNNNNNKRSVVEPPNSLQENRAQVDPHSQTRAASKYSVTIGLSLSRRHSTVGHPDTVTRQTAFDFNELQDRDYKYVSSTDSSGWRAGGGEKGGPHPTTPTGFDEDTDFYDHHRSNGQTTPMMVTPTQHHKVAAPDTVHIPIIQIDAETPEAVDTIVSALARGEVFIPHMSVLPEALSVNGISPPDLVVRFGCERNEDLPPDEWPNWCLEFMHNQLYEYFHSLGARWTKRPFQITLARKVRWKTVKHMNRYFAHAERVLDAWREKGPQYLDPQLTYIEGGATPEEVARPHGLYLMRNGVPTNYFAPNFDPPYTTKMTRSLLLNVLDKSWNKKHREWTSDPMPRIVTPTSLVATMCGCADPAQGGFMAAEVTRTQQLQSTTVDQAITLDDGDEEEKDAATRTRSKQEMALDTTKGDEEEEEGPMQTPPSHAREFDPIMQDRDQHEMPVASSNNNNKNKVELNPIDTATARDNTEKYVSPESSAASSSVVVNRSPSPRFGRAPIPEGMRSAKSPRATTDVGVASEVAESTSTVPIANSTSAKLIQREMERKKQVMMKQVTEEGDTPAIMDELSPNSTATATSGETNKSSRKKRRNKSKQEKKADMAREIAKVALSQSDQSDGRPAIVEASMQDPRKMELAQAVAHYEEKKLDGRYNASEPGEIPAVAPVTTTTTTTTTIKSPEVQRSDSNVSLEYSMDSSMLGDTSTLAGQVFTNENGSVSGATTATKRRSGKNQLPTRPIASSSSYNTVDDDLKSSMSLQSAGTEVPSDEDLFSVGWAKALDPKSGSYYYFTLDRTKIVWENPLATETTANTTTTTTTSPNAAAAI